MSRRTANITQADIARAIRAVQSAGLHVLRVVVRADGIALETVERRVPQGETDLAAESKVAENRRIVVL